MSLSVFAITNEQTRIIACIIFAMPGFIGWIIPYFCYLKISRTKTTQVSPLINQKYDEIYEVCEKANTLII